MKRCIDCAYFLNCDKAQQNLDCPSYMKRISTPEITSFWNNITINRTKIRYNNRVVSIQNSYEVENAFEMWTILTSFIRQTGYQSKRKPESWLKEWRVHNYFYRKGWFKENCKDCDLEENESGFRLIVYNIIDFFLNLGGNYGTRFR